MSIFDFSAQVFDMQPRPEPGILKRSGQATKNKKHIPHRNVRECPGSWKGIVAPMPILPRITAPMVW